MVITAKTSHPIATAVKPTSLITDHYAVECELLQSKPSRLKRHITYRKQSAINNNIFAADLRSFNLNADEADPVILLASYDTCLRTIIDAHAPLVSRTITVRPTTPWHTNDLTEAKRALRRAERLWRNSSLTVHRQIFKDRRNIFRKLLKTARSDYYRSEISKAGGNMRPYLRHHRFSSWPKGEYDSTRSGRRITLGTRYQIPAIFQKQDRSAVTESISAASRRHANSCGCALRRVRACVTFGCEKK